MAAGNSERMGQCKFLLPMRNGLSFFENILQVSTNWGIQNIIVVTQSKNLSKLKQLCRKIFVSVDFVINDYPELERFYSLQLGLNKLKNDYCFIHNADSPFLEEETLQKLYDNRRKSEVIIPVFQNKKGHPILINHFVVHHLRSLPVETNLKVALRCFKQKKIEVKNELIDVDFDTKSEYNKYFKFK